jgi:hypothetical protein
LVAEKDVVEEAFDRMVRSMPWTSAAAEFQTKRVK